MGGSRARERRRRPRAARAAPASSAAASSIDRRAIGIRRGLRSSGCHPCRGGGPAAVVQGFGRCGSGSSPTGSTAGRPSSPARSARPSTSSGTKPSSSPGRPGRRTSGPAGSTPRASGRRTRVTAASDYLIPGRRVPGLGRGDVRPDVVLFDQNYQFDEIARLRDSGVRTIGRFVWEHFAAEHVEPAGRAFDRIYSLTACEQQRYAEMGIETPRVRWGCFPDLVELARSLEPRRPGRPDAIPGWAETHMSSRPVPPRRPAETGREAEDLPGRSGPGLLPVSGRLHVEAQAARRDDRGVPGDVGDPRLRLVLKAQVERQAEAGRADDPRRLAASAAATAGSR